MRNNPAPVPKAGSGGSFRPGGRLCHVTLGRGEPGPRPPCRGRSEASAAPPGGTIPEPGGPKAEALRQVRAPSTALTASPGQTGQVPRARGAPRWGGLRGDTASISGPPTSDLAPFGRAQSHAVAAVRSEARGNRDRCQEPQRASRGGCAPAEGAPESGDTGPRVSPGTEAGGAPAGGPGLQGRWRFPPAPWGGPGQTSGHSVPQPQGRRGL